MATGCSSKLMVKDRQYYKFCFYGFLKNLRFFDAFFILFLIDRGVTFIYIGVLYTVREVVVNLFELPSGLLADAFGRKIALIFSFVLYILSFVVFYFSNSYVLFLIAFMVYGSAEAFRSGTHKGIIMDYLSIKGLSGCKIKYYGHTRACSQVGAALSSLFAGAVVFITDDYSKVFLFSIVPYFLNMILIMSYPGELNFSLSKRNTARESVAKVLKSFVKAIREIRLLRLISSMAVHSAYLKSVKDYIQPVMINFALVISLLKTFEVNKRNGIVVGVLYFFIYTLSSFASRFSAKFSERYSKNLVAVTLFMGLGFGAFAGIFYIEEYWVLSLLAFTGVYLVENIRKPAITGYVAENSPPEVFTSVISAQSVLKTIITSLLVLGLGALADCYGVGVAMVSISVGVMVFYVLIQVIYLARERSNK